MSDSTEYSISEGVPTNIYAVNAPINQAAPLPVGPGTEQIVSKGHGDYYQAARAGALFSFNVTAQTVPVVASGLVSVCSLYNPPTSGKYLELLELNYGLVLATTVVDTIGLYWQGAVLAGKATFTTKGVVGTNWFGGLAGNNGGSGTPYTAFTHSGTPTRIAIMGNFGAVTATNDMPCSYKFNGRVLVAPGEVVSVAMSTGASTVSGVDLELVWLETV